MQDRKEEPLPFDTDIVMELLGLHQMTDTDDNSGDESPNNNSEGSESSEEGNDSTVTESDLDAHDSTDLPNEIASAVRVGAALRTVLALNMLIERQAHTHVSMYSDSSDAITIIMDFEDSESDSEDETDSEDELSNSAAAAA